jgi:O-antigen/teichoic acid export membrane protein
VVTTNSIEATTSDSGARQPSSGVMRRNALRLLAGNAVYTACQWGMLVALTRFTNVPDVGRFALAFAVTAPVFLFTGLRLRTTLVTDTHHKYRYADFAFARLGSNAAAFLLLALYIIGTSASASTTELILLVGLAKAFEAGSDLIYAEWQQRGLLNRVALSMALRGVASLAIFVAVVSTGYGARGGCRALASVWGVAFLCDLRYSKFFARATWSGIHWRNLRCGRLIRNTVPLGLGAMLASLQSNVPRFFVERYLGVAHLALFAAAAWPALAGNLVVNAVAESACARLAHSHASPGHSGFASLLTRLSLAGLALGLAGALVAALAGYRLLGLFYPAEYTGAVRVLTILMVAAALANVASFLHYGMVSAGRFTSQMAVMIATSAATLLSSVILIPRFGLEGAAFAVIVAMLVQIAGSVAALHKELLGGSSPV